jgi:hypothetical protein
MLSFGGTAELKVPTEKGGPILSFPDKNVYTI